MRADLGAYVEIVHAVVGPCFCTCFDLCIRVLAYITFMTSRCEGQIRMLGLVSPRAFCLPHSDPCYYLFVIADSSSDFSKLNLLMLHCLSVPPMRTWQLGAYSLWLRSTLQM